MKKSIHITILGGGLAGLGVGYYAKKKGMSFKIYEAGNRTGGNCVTLKKGDFFFDSGAHRLHDKDAAVTKELKKLLGKDLKKINIPSQIYHNGKFIDFPFSPLNLMKNLGLHTFGKAAIEVMQSRLRTKRKDSSFESFALETYGNTIAESFLLNYSEKLWGLPCNRLSLGVSGKRLKGLNFKTFLMEAMFGQKTKSDHVEGAFYYPKMGIGTIAKKLKEFCGEENVLENSRVTKILHSHKRIDAIEVNGKKKIAVDEMVNTLPIHLLLQMMKPSPPEEILLLTKRLHYRDVILVAFFLNRESVTKAATTYFPDHKFPFTRVYEPKNRSMHMAPEGKTSLVVEIPCQQDDKFWNMQDDMLVRLMQTQLIQVGLIKEAEVIDTSVSRLDYAYPILEIGVEEKMQKIDEFLKVFTNLKISGRNGRFLYSWIHDMMRFGDTIIKEYISK
ncbi:protoporphyrinogen/coproporphyrinogen oxidase [Candidatus Omnitrophota bacterium]